MKKIYFLPILFYLCQLQAQDLNRAYHHGSEKTFGIQSLNNKFYYLEVSMSIGSCCQEIYNLVAQDFSGTPATRVPLFGYAWPTAGIMEKTSDLHFLISGGSPMRGCDYGPAEYRVLKSDTLGAIKWQYTVKHPVRAILPITDSTYFLLLNDTLHHYTNTQPTQKLSLGVNNIYRVAPLNNNRYVIAHADAQGMSVLRTIDSSGQPLKALKIISEVVSIQPLGDTIYVQCPGVIHRFNDTLGIIGSPGSIGVQAMTVNNHSVFVTGTSSSGQLFFTVLDQSLTPVHTSQSAVRQVTASGITHAGDRAGIITWGTSKSQPTQSFTGFFQVQAHGQLVAEKDIGITRLQVLQANTFNFSNNISAVVDVQVTLKNYGISEINTFNLNHYARTDGISYCLIGLNKTFSVPIPPGDSAVVSTGTFYLNPFVPGSNTVTAYDYKLSIFSSVPDKRNDINVQNDEASLNIKLTPTAINIHHQEESIAIFPNPSSAGFTIAGESPLLSIELTDLQGRSVETLSGLNVLEVTVGKGVSAGVYILEITTREKRVHRKVVVE